MDDDNGSEPLGVQAELEVQASDDSISSSSNSPSCIPDRMVPCCCGNDDCTFQRQNHETFASLDENLRKAGRLGQVSVS